MKINDRKLISLLSHMVTVLPCNDSTAHELEKKLDALESEDKCTQCDSTEFRCAICEALKDDESLAKCNDCGSKDLRVSGDDLICNRCGDNQSYPRCSQVVLRIKNTDRTDILAALNIWKEQLNPQSRKSAEKLFEYIDNAGYED